jgi:hypothetical protein
MNMGLKIRECPIKLIVIFQSDEDRKRALDQTTFLSKSWSVTKIKKQPAVELEFELPAMAGEWVSRAIQAKVPFEITASYPEEKTTP